MNHGIISKIFHDHLDEFVIKYPTSRYEQKVLGAIAQCRTGELGYYISECEQCATKMVLPRSCGNRHCPTCGNGNKELWLYNQSHYIMNIPYYHIVFTIPEELNVFFVEYKRDLLEFLLKASSDTLLELCRDSTHLGAQIGFTSIIHTWGSNMCFHPHIHAMVSSGGITENEQWVSKGNKFFLPVRVVSALFKGKFMAKVKELRPQLSSMSDEEYYAIIDKIYKKDWVVYTKEPFKDASQVMNYLGRYTHRVAISENRILNYDGENVTFKYKDYKQNGIWRTMTVSALEFIRRFVLHILPQRLTKIRHYGFLSPKNKDKRIKLIKELTNTRVFDFIKKTKYQILSDKYGLDFRLCPCCRCSPNTNKRE